MDILTILKFLCGFSIVYSLSNITNSQTKQILTSQVTRICICFIRTLSILLYNVGATIFWSKKVYIVRCTSIVRQNDKNRLRISHWKCIKLLRFLSVSFLGLLKFTHHQQQSSLVRDCSISINRRLITKC